MGMKLLREVFDWLLADLKAFFKNPFKWVWKKIRLGAKRDREKNQDAVDMKTGIQWFRAPCPDVNPKFAAVSRHGNGYFNQRTRLQFLN